MYKKIIAIVFLWAVMPLFGKVTVEQLEAERDDIGNVRSSNILDGRPADGAMIDQRMTTVEAEIERLRLEKASVGEDIDWGSGGSVLKVLPAGAVAAGAGTPAVAAGAASVPLIGKGVIPIAFQKKSKKFYCLLGYDSKNKFWRTLPAESDAAKRLGLEKAIKLPSAPPYIGEGKTITLELVDENIGDIPEANKDWSEKVGMQVVWISVNGIVAGEYNVGDASRAAIRFATNQGYFARWVESIKPIGYIPFAQNAGEEEFLLMKAPNNTWTFFRGEVPWHLLLLLPGARTDIEVQTSNGKNVAIVHIAWSPGGTLGPTLGQNVTWFRSKDVMAGKIEKHGASIDPETLALWSQAEA